MRHLIFLCFLGYSALAIGQTKAMKLDSLIRLAKRAVDEENEEKAWAFTLKAAELSGSKDFCAYKFPWEEIGYYYKDSEAYSKRNRANLAWMEKYLAYPLKVCKSVAQDYENEALECWSDLNSYLGESLRDQGKIAAAKNAFEAAFDGYQKLEQSNYKFEKGWVIGAIYIPLANIYTRLEDYKSAASLHLLAQNEFSKLGMKQRMAETATDYGILLTTMGNMEQAIEVFSKQLDYPDLSARTKTIVLENRANCFLHMNKLSSAMSDVEQAIELGGKLEKGAPFLMTAYSVKGEIESKMKQYEKATNDLQQALRFGLEFYPKRSRQIGKIYVRLGDLSRLQQQEAKALSYYQQALFTVLPGIDTLEVHQSPLRDSLIPENTILESLEGKASTYQQLAEKETSPNRYLSLALDNLQLCFAEEQLLSTAQLHASSKVKFQNLNRKRRETALDICAKLQRLTGKEKYALLAFDIAEGGKANVLLEGVTDYLIRKKMSDDQGILNSIDLLEKELSKIEAKMQGLSSENEKESGEKEVLNRQSVLLSQQLRGMKQQLKKQAAYMARLHSEEKHDLADLVRDSLLLDTKTVFVEYVLATDYLFGFSLIKNRAVHFFSIPRDEDFNATLLAFAENFSAEKRWNVGAEHYQNTAVDFYEKILAPAMINDFEEVIIVPDGRLAAIPFEALVTTMVENPIFKNLDYLLKHKNIRYAYSAAVLLTQNKQAFVDPSLLVVAPDFAKTDWGLPALDVNALRIKGFDHYEVMGGGQATKHHFIQEAQKYRYIHLFTHADADKKGTLPRIYFEDSILTLPEIYTLDLSAELVVLSACETNLGKLEKGEGVMSLSRGFAYAGVSSLISSLWKVKDQQTAELFSSFYDALQKNNGQKSTALRQSKLNYLAATDDIHASPGYWAGFVFIGSEHTPHPNHFWWWVLAGCVGLGLGGLMVKRIRA